MRTRVIPVLQLQDGRLVKTRRFRQPVYIGDPINAVKIFNDKEVDELIILDIGATALGRGPDLANLRRLADEAFMPMAYGGGLANLADMQAVLKAGFEKLVLSTSALADPALIGQAAAEFGSQSVVVSIDVALRGLCHRRQLVHGRGGTQISRIRPVDHARAMAAAGAGEIIISCIDRDGGMSGYDLELIRSIASAVSVPVVALGGAGCMQDLADAAEAGAAGIAAGSMFVFHGPHRAVLITYPERNALESLFP